MDPTELLREIFAAAIEAVAPAKVLPAFLPLPSPGRTVVVGAGKAAAAMARSVEPHWQGELRGLVVTRHGHGVPCHRIEVVEAAHPIPNERGVRAAHRILQLVSGLGQDDLVLCLLSGGGSALLTLPAPGLTLTDKQEVTAKLLRSGAPISEINCVRKHLSAIKGGRLAAACAPARVVTLAISDVPGDDPGLIASGPTVPDPTTREQAAAVLERLGLAAGDAVMRCLEEGEETPKPGDPCFACSEVAIVARSADALAAAAAVAREAGLRAEILGDGIEGEAREVARAQARQALRAVAEGRGCVLLSGGETTVTVDGTGRGGPNGEFLLALALALDGHADIWALAGDTDGIDGTEQNAGCILAPDSLSRARALGLDPVACLLEHDSYRFFAALGDLLLTGPTRTNVNDLRAILVAPGGAGETFRGV